MSVEFMQQPIVDLLVWMRVPGDTIFSIGALILCWFVGSLWLRPRRDPAAIEHAAGEAEARRIARMT